MAKHKLYRQFENTSPLTLSLSEEISPERDVHPSTADTEAHVRLSSVKSNCAYKSVRNNKSGNKKGVTNKNINHSSSESLLDEECVSLPHGDSDSDDLYDTYSKLGLKIPYSAKEDEWILKFVLKGQNVFKVGSLSLWKHLESKKENPKRTYQSLKNRFLRSIKPHLFTRYTHLISDDKKIEKILARFPELRCKVGRTNTLSRIQLPARNPNSKFAEGELVNGSRDNDERITSPRRSTSEGPPKGSARREPILNMNFSNFERKVTIRDKSLAVWVNFNSKQQLPKPVTPPIGIYEQYKKFKKKNKLVLCAACGRYNQPRKNKLADSKGDGESLNFSAGRQVLTASSSDAEPGNSSVTRSGTPPAKCRKVGEADLRLCSPCSPNLLRDAGEENYSTVCWDIQNRPLKTDEVGRAPEMPSSSSVVLRQRGDSAAADRLKEAGNGLDSTYDDAVADFKKLIKNEEERSLVRKCLHGKGGILGLSDSISQISMESYFVDLSPNLETPELTANFTSQLNAISERDNSPSLLARNMMKMLEENKTSGKS